MNTGKRRGHGAHSVVYEGMDERHGHGGFLAVKRVTTAGLPLLVARLVLSMVESELGLHYDLADQGLAQYICSPIGHSQYYAQAAVGRPCRPQGLRSWCFCCVSAQTSSQRGRRTRWTSSPPSCPPRSRTSWTPTRPSIGCLSTSASGTHYSPTCILPWRQREAAGRHGVRGGVDEACWLILHVLAVCQGAPGGGARAGLPPSGAREARQAPAGVSGPQTSVVD